MSGVLWKVDSGTDKQFIKAKTWTYVRFAGKESFKIPVSGVWELTVILRVEYPIMSTGNVLRGRLVRYPKTAQLDETGHDDKNTSNWDGKVLHSHWSHTIDCTTAMPIGFWVWHDGNAPIILDGRQLKAKKI